MGENYIMRSFIVCTLNLILFAEISGSHSSEYEDDCLLGCAM
jgi:hypothetical protein